MDLAKVSPSRHFQLQMLAEGVFAAVASPEGAAIGNAGLINLGGQLLVFDTFMTPQAAVDLRRAAYELFGQGPQFVINSHYHNDHIWGNQVFANEAVIVSTARTRALITTAGREEFAWYSAHSGQRLESLRAECRSATDEERRRQVSFWLPYYEGLVEALPTLQVCLPVLTFEIRQEFHGERYRAELLAFEGAHTGSDTVLYLPEAGVVFMSDLLFVGCHPYLADGDPAKLLETLRELSRLEATHYVSGHGAVGKAEDLRLMITYVEQVLEMAEKLKKEGDLSDTRIAALRPPAPFDEWLYPGFFEANIRFLCQRD
jgi:cyclase